MNHTQFFNYCIQHAKDSHQLAKRYKKFPAVHESCIKNRDLYLRSARAISKE